MIRTTYRVVIGIVLGACTGALAAAPIHAQEPSATEIADLLQGVPNGSWRSTYVAPSSPPTLIRGVTIMTAAGRELTNASILFEDGRISRIGSDFDVPADAEIIDGTGRFVTPGLIDSHSHIGVSPRPG